MLKRTFLFFLICTTVFLTSGFNFAFAQELILENEAKTPGVSAAAEFDNDLGPELLGVGRPSILPDSKLYFVKELGRGLSNAFTFSDDKKAEKRLDQAASRLAEIQAMVKSGNGTDAALQAISKYNKDISAAQEKMASIDKTNQSYNDLMEKAVGKYAAFSKVLAPTEDVSLDISQDLILNIYNAKNTALENLAGTFQKLDAPEEIMANILSSQPGSEFKGFKNLEVLSELQEKLPKGNGEAITEAQAKMNEKILDDFTRSVQGKTGEEFSGYVMGLKGSEAVHIGIMNELAKETSLPDEIVAGFRQAKDSVAVEFSQKMIKHPAVEEMMEQIASGDIDKLIILEDMADALPDSAEVKKTLEAARQKGLDRAVEKINKIQSVDEKINFLIKDGAPDTKSFVMMEQIQSKLAPAQQEQMKAVRNQAFKIFSDIVDSAENSDKLLSRLAGDSPKDVELIAVIKKNLPAGLAPKFDSLVKKQLEKVEERLSNENDITKLMEMRTELDDSPEAKDLMDKMSPNMVENINKKQAEKVSQIFDQAQNAEDMIKLANQYNGLLEKFPDVAKSFQEKNPDLIKNIAAKQIEKIQAELKSASSPEEMNEIMKKFQAAGLDKLKGNMPPEMEAKIGQEMKAIAKDKEKSAFLKEMQAKLGDKYNAAEAEKMFDEIIGKQIDSAGEMPDQAKIAEMKAAMEQEMSAKMAEEQKRKEIQAQVQEELDKNTTGPKPSAGDLTDKIMQDDRVKDMTAPPSQAEIDAIKAEMEAKARAEAEKQAAQNMPPPSSSPSPSAPPPSVPTPAPDQPASIPSVDCSQFSSVPSCDMVPASVQSMCRSCK